ncbi:hypothetical protein [Tenacibaculum sp. IB213877]|uniref:hypothetical protein n=1 Tax=Tenacibaculum sp. IB213877 TaxID=3097351 RepID=UPI002A59CFDE|nr:hypothetical protein [Tenacibaculum sp. IB213877]MDY0781088.1 hypothetical protein [Tenacibaculum sp. IB213877]
MKKIVGFIPFFLFILSLNAQDKNTQLTLSSEMILAPTILDKENNIAVMGLYRKNNGTPVSVVEAGNLLNQTINAQKPTNFTQITMYSGKYSSEGQKYNIDNDFQKANFTVKDLKKFLERLPSKYFL